MRRILLSSALVAICSPVASAQWFDDFDSYTAGTQIVGQGGWEEWGAGAGALVSSAQSRTPGNSVDINGPTDLVYQYTGYNTGTWVYKAHQYIPTGTTGQSYFIMLNTYAYPSGPYSWSMQLLCDAAAGTVSQRCGGAATISLPLVVDQWSEIKVVVDLDQDWGQIYYNGALLDDPAVPDHPVLGGGYTWSLGDGGTNTTGQANIGAVDLFANGASAVYYDDISLTRPEAWYDDFDAYAIGSQVVGQGGWEEWGAGAGALVSSAQSRSSANSIDIVGATDLVYQYAHTSGKWVYKAHQYIPTGTTGTSYFILLNTYAYPSGPYSWSAQLAFDTAAGTVSQRCGGAATVSLPFVFDQWSEIKAVIDLDQDWVQIYYNGELLDDPVVPDHPVLGGGYIWSLGDRGVNTTGQAAFGAVDLFANNASAVYYDDMSLTPFEYETFGLGCAGSMPASQLTLVHPARLGQNLVVEVNNLPQLTAVMTFGFGNMSSPLGALPLELSAYGMPNCYMRVRVDWLGFLVGIGNTATHTVAIPNNPWLLGTMFHEQALVLDPTAGNAAGHVVSDAATGLLVH